MQRNSPVAARDGGPVVLRPVMAIRCYWSVQGARLATVAGVCRRHLSSSATLHSGLAGGFTCAGQAMTLCHLQSNYSFAAARLASSVTSSQCDVLFQMKQRMRLLTRLKLKHVCPSVTRTAFRTRGWGRCQRGMDVKEERREGGNGKRKKKSENGKM